MPANNQTHGPRAALARLLRMAKSWRRRRTAGRRVQLHVFTHMSDRMLADIGVRRADVNAALAGMVPVEQIARTHGGAPWSAPVQALRPQTRRCCEGFGPHDLGAAA